MKNKNIFIIWGAIISIFVIFFIVRIAFAPSQSKYTPSSPHTITQTPLPSRQAHLERIIPGNTTEASVIATLGTPMSTTVENGFEVLAYALPATRRVNRVYLTNKTVQYITEEIPNDNSLYIDYLNHNKLLPDGTFYDKEHDAGFNWYIFANSGVAFLANPSNGYTIRMLHFQSMQYQTFLNTTAKTFSLSPTPIETIDKFK